jgi:erythromycin esterase
MRPWPTNVLWALDQEGPAGKVLLFAHNAHINATTRSGMWSGLSRPAEAMGEYLKARLGDGMVAIGSCSLEKPAGITIGNSLEDALRGLGPGSFVLDLRKARSAVTASAWLNRGGNLGTNGDTFLKLKPAAAFDAIVCWERLTPSHAAER